MSKRFLTSDEHRLLCLIGNEELTIEQIMQAARKFKITPSIPIFDLVEASLRSGIITGHKNGFVFSFFNNVGNCTDIDDEDYARWIACFSAHLQGGKCKKKLGSKKALTSPALKNGCLLEIRFWFLSFIIQALSVIFIDTGRNYGTKSTNSRSDTTGVNQ